MNSNADFPALLKRNGARKEIAPPKAEVLAYKAISKNPPPTLHDSHNIPLSNQISMVVRLEAVGAVVG